MFPQSTFRYVKVVKQFAKFFSYHAKCDTWIFINQIYEEIRMFLCYLTIVYFYGSIINLGGLLYTIDENNSSIAFIPLFDYSISSRTYVLRSICFIS
jgi:hypothetical protein